MTPGAIRLDESQWMAMVNHLQACLPEEGCGLLGGRGELVDLVLPVENVEHSRVRYTMEPHALIRGFVQLEEDGLELVAAFHSHPLGPSGVSDSDVREWQYPEAALVVCVPGGTEWGAQAFVVDGGGVRQIPFQVGGG